MPATTTTTTTTAAAAAAAAAYPHTRNNQQQAAHHPRNHEQQQHFEQQQQQLQQQQLAALGPPRAPKLDFSMPEFYLTFVSAALDPHMPYTHLQSTCLYFLSTARLSPTDVWLSRDASTVSLSERGERILQDLNYLRRRNWAAVRVQAIARGWLARRRCDRARAKGKNVARSMTTYETALRARMNKDKVARAAGDAAAATAAVAAEEEATPTTPPRARVMTPYMKDSDGSDEGSDHGGGGDNHRDAFRDLQPQPAAGAGAEEATADFLPPVRPLTMLELPSWETLETLREAAPKSAPAESAVGSPNGSEQQRNSFVPHPALVAAGHPTWHQDANAAAAAAGAEPPVPVPAVERPPLTRKLTRPPRPPQNDIPSSPPPAVAQTTNVTAAPPTSQPRQQQPQSQMGQQRPAEAAVVNNPRHSKRAAGLRNHLGRISMAYEQILANGEGFQPGAATPTTTEINFMKLLNSDSTFILSANIGKLGPADASDLDFMDRRRSANPDRSAAHYAQLSPRVEDWIRATLQLPHHNQQPQPDLMTHLQSGDILCRLACELYPRTQCQLLSKGPEFTVHKVIFFLELCKTVGVKNKNIFAVADLLGSDVRVDPGRRGPLKVVRTLHALERQARRQGWEGPKLETKIEPTPEEIAMAARPKSGESVYSMYTYARNDPVPGVDALEEVPERDEEQEVEEEPMEDEDRGDQELHVFEAYEGKSEGELTLPRANTHHMRDMYDRNADVMSDDESGSGKATTNRSKSASPSSNHHRRQYESSDDDQTTRAGSPMSFITASQGYSESAAGDVDDYDEDVAGVHSDAESTSTVRWYDTRRTSTPLTVITDPLSGADEWAFGGALPDSAVHMLEQNPAALAAAGKKENILVPEVSPVVEEQEEDEDEEEARTPTGPGGFEEFGFRSVSSAAPAPTPAQESDDYSDDVTTPTDTQPREEHESYAMMYNGHHLQPPSSPPATPLPPSPKALPAIITQQSASPSYPFLAGPPPMSALPRTPSRPSSLEVPQPAQHHPYEHSYEHPYEHHDQHAYPYDLDEEYSPYDAVAAMEAEERDNNAAAREAAVAEAPAPPPVAALPATPTLLAAQHLPTPAPSPVATTTYFAQPTGLLPMLSALPPSPPQHKDERVVSPPTTRAVQHALSPAEEAQRKLDKQREAGIAQLLLSEEIFIHDLSLAQTYVAQLVRSRRDHAASKKKRTSTSSASSSLSSTSARSSSSSTSSLALPDQQAELYAQLDVALRDLLALHRRLLPHLRAAAFAPTIISNDNDDGTRNNTNTNTKVNVARVLASRILAFATEAIPMYSAYAVLKRAVLNDGADVAAFAAYARGCFKSGAVAYGQEGAEEVVDRPVRRLGRLAAAVRVATRPERAGVLAAVKIEQCVKGIEAAMRVI
ncbi:hypothetical protein HDU89_006514 [Geranomyces variabilis]|nr:hypothetical protein HDU89_006514 [Geranomyces variabilis]